MLKKHIPTTNIFKKFLYFIFEFSKIKKESKLYIGIKKKDVDLIFCNELA